MSYKYRVCFQFAGDGTFTGEEKFIDFQINKTGERLKLSAVDKEKSFDSSNRFTVTSEPYEKVEEAQASAEKVRIAILYYATKERVGIDLGKYALRGGLTEDGRKIFSQRSGVPVQNDRLGISVFQAEPAPIFLKLDGKGILGKSTNTFVDTLKQAHGSYPFKSPKAELAVELYSMSHFESNSNARFLTLFMCLETLFEPLPRSDKARSHVDSLIQATKNAEIPVNDRESLIGSLAWLKKQSIAQTGKRMARELLAEKEYCSMTAEMFFQKISETRNDLVHRGTVNPREVRNMLGEVDRFVSDILQKQFIYS